MYYKRDLEEKIKAYIDKPEIIAVLGPRQVGKTTLLKKIYEESEEAVFLTFEDRDICYQEANNNKLAQQL